MKTPAAVVAALSVFPFACLSAQQESVQAQSSTTVRIVAKPRDAQAEATQGAQQGRGAEAQRSGEQPTKQGQQPQQTQQGPFVLEAGEIEIKDLVDKASSYLGVNILLEPHESVMTSPPKLQHRIETDADGCRDLLSSLLYRAGLAIVPLDENQGLHEVILMAGPRGREITNRAQRKSAAEILAKPNLYEQVLTTVQLEHINAQLANNALRPFFASTGGAMGGSSLTIGNVGNNSSLLLQGWQPQVAAALRLLDECDKPGTPTPMEEAMQARIEKLEARIVNLEKVLAQVLEKGK